MGKLDGKVAFITGAARGQGRSHAIRLAREGADIIALDLCGPLETVPYPLSTPEDLAESVRQIEGLDRRIVARQGDVRDLGQVQRAVQDGVGELGRVDIVLANAGICSLTLNERDPVAAFNETIEVNLHGVWNTVHAALPTMIEQGDGGSIVITSSTQGFSGKGGNGSGAQDAYVASKHAVVGLMRTWAHWLGEHRIRVNTIHPTGVNSPMVNNDAMMEFLEGSPGAAEIIKNLIPVELLEPVDVSNAIAWLVSDDAKYVTGVTLPIDAGAGCP